MKIKLKNKESWNKIFVVLPVRTLENTLVWVENVYTRDRFIGYDTSDCGRDFVTEYTQDVSKYE